MKKKQELIKEAYGESWDHVKDVADPHGWVNEDDVTFDMADFKSTEIEFSTYASGYWRVKGLSGIDDNNGWTRTSDRLPKDGQSVVVWYTGLGNYQYPQDYEYYSDRKKWMIENTSHWRPKVEIKPPLYQ